MALDRLPQDVVESDSTDSIFAEQGADGVEQVGFDGCPAVVLQFVDRGAAANGDHSVVDHATMALEGGQDGDLVLFGDDGVQMEFELDPHRRGAASGGIVLVRGRGESKISDFDFFDRFEGRVEFELFEVVVQLDDFFAAAAGQSEQACQERKETERAALKSAVVSWWNHRSVGWALPTSCEIILILVGSAHPTLLILVAMPPCTFELYVTGEDCELSFKW